jgi:charged multivesicular body protein 3
MFGKTKTPREQTREWASALRKESRAIEREVHRIEREESKMLADIKKAAAKHDQKSLKILCKSMLQSKKTKERMYSTQAQINSTVMQLKEQAATMKVVGTMAHSTQLMKSMSALMNVKQISLVARSMAKEMEKAGMIGEIVEDAFESLDDDDVEELADAEVDKIVAEVTNGQFASLGELKRPKPVRFTRFSRVVLIRAGGT